MKRIFRAIATTTLLLTFVSTTIAQTTRQFRGITFEEPAPVPISGRRITATYAAAGAPGAITLYYWLAVTYPIGSMFPVGPITVTNTAALGGANTVSIDWPTVVGATSYTVILTATPQFPTAGACVACALVVNAPVTILVDNGAVLVAGFQTSGINKAEATTQIDNRDWTNPVLELGQGNTNAFRVQSLNNFQLGDNNTRYANFITGDNLISVFATDAVATGYTDAIQGDINATGGNGTGAVRGFVGRARANAGSDLGELYGVDGWAVMNNGGRVRTNVYGTVGYLDINVGATVPVQYVQGVLGVLDSAVSLAFPAISGAVTADVTWSANPQQFDGAFVAFRDGAGAGGTEGAAFKLKRIATNTIDEFAIGLDLYGGAAAGQDGVTNSIRGQLQTVLDNETLWKWQTNAEVYVGAQASAFGDWAARTDVVVQGFRSRISHDVATATTTVYGGRFEVEAQDTTAGGFFAGVRGNATTEAGITGTDIFDGVYGSANPSDGLVVGSYGVFGILDIDGTTTAGLNWMGAGVKGEYDDIVGINEDAVYTAGVMGYVGDQDTIGPDGAVVAVLGGGGTRTANNPPIAAYRVIDLSAVADVSFTYGMDFYWNDGVVTNSTEFLNADIRGANQVTLKNDIAAEWTITDEDDTVLGTESLTAPADFSQAQWAVAAEFAVAGTFARYTFAATGLGTVTQTAAGNLALDGIGNQWYRLAYTIGAGPTVANAVLTLTNAFGLAAVTLPITAGANVVYFESAVAPANFVFNVAGATAGTFDIEQASLRQVQSGDLVTRGPIRLVSVYFVDLPAAVNGSIMYCEDCDQAAAGAGPLVCASTPGTGALAIRAGGAWTCLGI